MLKGLFKVALLAGIVLFSTAQPAQANHCFRTGTLLYWSDMVGVSNIPLLKPEQKAAVVEGFNNEPPKTNAQPERVYAIKYGNTGKYLVLFWDQGCVRGAWAIPVKTVKTWLRQLKI